MSTSTTPTNPLFGGTDWMGVCYSPYHQSKDTPFSAYKDTDIEADMKIIAQYYSFIRTYTVQYANVYNVKYAAANNLKVALGAWIFGTGTTPDPDKKCSGGSIDSDTKTEIDTVLKQANDYSDTVVCIVIGNEVDQPTNNYSAAQVKAALDYAKTQKADKTTYPNIQDTPITTCMTGTGPNNSDWSCLLSEMEDYAFLTIYPWWATNTPDPSDITGNMKWSYNNGMKQAEAAGLTVVIAEIGWPSDGPSNKKCSVDNEETNYKATCDWINGTNFLSKPFVSMWFEMFDEPWKVKEGTQGPHWGLYTSGKSPTAKFTIPSCTAKS